MNSSPILNLVVIRSGDIDRSVAFYKAMGLPFEKHRHGAGPEHYASEIAGSVFEIYPLGKEDHSPTPIRIGFSVEDVDSVVDLLVKTGARVISKPKDSEWGRRAVMKDLDGNKVELITPPNRDTLVDK